MSNAKLTKEQLEYVESRGCKIIEVIYRQEKQGKGRKVKNRLAIKYICKCGVEMQKNFKDFEKGKACRKCNSKNLREIPKEDYIEKDGKEIWKPIEGGWVSSLGNIKKVNGQSCKVSKDMRITINKKAHYLSRIIAVAFQIEDYDKLDSQSYVVSFKDGNDTNLKLDNLYIRKKIGSKNKYSETDRYREVISWKRDKFDGIPFKYVPEISDCFKIYQNGQIYNGKRFLAFTNNEGYYTLTYGKGEKIYVHRLICYTFNPIPNFKSIKDYTMLQVNHKNGNKLDNRAENLEWCTQSENIKHSYRNLDMKSKLIPVVQTDKFGNFINVYDSIATASKLSGEPEHRIRSDINGKPYSCYIFRWKKSFGVDYDEQYYLFENRGKKICAPFESSHIIFLDENDNIIYDDLDYFGDKI